MMRTAMRMRSRRFAIARTAWTCLRLCSYIVEVIKGHAVDNVSGIALRSRETGELMRRRASSNTRSSGRDMKTAKIRGSQKKT